MATEVTPDSLREAIRDLKESDELDDWEEDSRVSVVVQVPPQSSRHSWKPDAKSIGGAIVTLAAAVTATLGALQNCSP